ncbi:hypothetical protein SZN_14006 [Streptomyces zinciresistens K42]|uniref:Uncharacterized protein n=1 Tax=Streptomyces zinciresistens K42 TaxID=700597 RepID=G2GBC7_9ACTN|nr:hypothetical protein SZN_14006 [Streptomyces zinciresistens K42]
MPTVAELLEGALCTFTALQEMVVVPDVAACAAGARATAEPATERPSAPTAAARPSRVRMSMVLPIDRDGWLRRGGDTRGR